MSPGWLEDRRERGRVFLSPFDVVFSFHDVVGPDPVFVAHDELDILTDKNISRRARTRGRDSVAVDAHARRAGEAPPGRAHRCAGRFAYNPPDRETMRPRVRLVLVCLAVVEIACAQQAQAPQPNQDSQPPMGVREPT
jgi:hypothetical protein